LAVSLLSETVELDHINIEESYIPASHHILSQTDASRTASTSLHERLQRDVSFNTIQNQGALSFRGLSHKATDFVEDGIPIFSTVNGFTNTQVYMNDVELEINDGSGFSSFGVSPMGGEVLIHSKLPVKQFQSKVKTTITSNDEYIYTNIGSKIDNFYIQADTTYYHRSDYELSDNYDATSLQNKGARLNSDMQQKSVSLKSGIFLGDGTHLGTKISVNRSEYGIPPNIYADQGTPVVWDAYTRIDAIYLNSFYLYADHNVDDMTLSFRGYYDEYEDRWRIFNEPDYQSSWPLMIYDDKRMGTILKGSMQNNAHKSTIVLQFEHNEHNAREQCALSDPKFVLHTFKGSYLHLWKPDTAWQVDSAISYTLLKDKKRDNVSIIDPAEDKEVWDALLKLTYTDDLSTYYGSVAKKSRMPSMNQMFTFFPWEVANPDLKPERSIQYAAGYQYMLDETSLIDMSMYYYDISDLIIYRNNGYINHEEAENYGVEIRLESERYKDHLLQLSYAYTHARDSEDEFLELIPEHRLKLDDTITINHKWEGHIGYQYIGSRYSQNTATYTDEWKNLNGYHLVDTQLSYNGIKQTTFRAGIKNVLDEAYESKYGYPTEGRSFYLSVEWEL